MTMIATTHRPDPDVLVIGLGYAGLSLAAEACGAQLAVVGLDVSDEVVRGLNAGVSPHGDVSHSVVAAMLMRGFRATADESDVGRPRTIVICVPTPLSADAGPDISRVVSAAETAARLLRPGALVVLESTTYPGTTEHVVRPVLEKASGLTAGLDFSLAFSPERIDPGNSAYGVRNTPKVVGGVSASCTNAAADFYSLICDQVVRTSSAREAEMAKLLENTYRHVNIALVNEMAIFCHELGVDIWEVIRCAATKPFGFQAFYPGPGVGGQCIPVDPNYLSYKVRTLGYPFHFVELAQEINNRMPGYVIRRAAEVLNKHKKSLNGARVLLLGVTYKRDSADLRSSPAEPIVRKLRSAGALVSFADPHAETWLVDGEPVVNDGVSQASVSLADLVIVLQPHKAFRYDEIERAATLILDTCGATARGERM